MTDKELWRQMEQIASEERKRKIFQRSDAIRGHAPHKQEIVKIELTPHSKDEMFLSNVQEQSNQSLHNGVVKISIADMVLRIPNRTDSVLLRQTFQPDKMMRKPKAYIKKIQPISEKLFMEL